MPERRTPVPDGLDDGWEVDLPEPPEMALSAPGVLRAPPVPRVSIGRGAPVTLPPERTRHLEHPTPPPPTEAAPRGDLATVPPPVPQDEYVAEMMAKAEPSRPRRETVGYREPMATIHEEEPLRFDLPEDRATPVGGSSAAHGSAAGHDAPAIELVEELLDLDDPELLRETPVPPPPGAGEAASLDLALGLSVPDDRVHVISDLPVDLAEPQHVQLGELELLEEEDDPGRPTLPGHDPQSREGAIQDRFVLGDYSGALVLAEALLEEEPDHAVARHYAETCRDMLRQMYESRLGDRSHTVRVAMSPDQLRWLTLDHRAGFLLSCVDGMSSVDEILDVCGMSQLEALRTLYDLVQQGVVVIEPRNKRR